ncbi:hypothetical protein SRHO_G00137960 [Serrasalmus rhombeus]
MIRAKLVIVSLFWLTDSVFSNKVQQSPSDVIKTSGVPVELQCLHSISSYNVILWYKKTADQTLVLMGSLVMSTGCLACQLTMFEMFLKLMSLMILVTGSLNAVAVQQTPSDLIKNQGQSAEITCSHNIQSHDRILWYKQSQTKELTFMGYLFVDSGNPEPEFNNKIKISGNSNEFHGSLTMTNLSLDSTAVYFCAAYYTVVLLPPTSVQKLIAVSIFSLEVCTAASNHSTPL